jgi:hypothetical protein
MARKIEFTKTWSVPEGKLVAIRIDFSKRPSKAITYISESAPRYISEGFTVREMWRVSNGVVQRRQDLLHHSGMYEILSDWETTDARYAPLLLVPPEKRIFHYGLGNSLV